MSEEEPSKRPTAPRNAAQTVIASLAERNLSAQKVFDRFFDWYPDVWFVNDEIVSTLNNMPRPLREIAVTHQAFCMMSNGGPSNYFLHFESLFDIEVKLGLEELGFAAAYTQIANGRMLFNASPDRDLSIEQSAKFFEHLPSLDAIEIRIGQWLIDKHNSFADH